MSRAFKIGFLLLGDIIALYLALLLALFIRYGGIFFNILWEEHLITFSIIFLVWLMVFYIHDLYDLTAAKNTLSFYTTFLRMLLVNFAIAAAFFYFVPFFAITPKRNLFLFMAVFAIVFALWRQFANRTLKKRLHTPTVIIGRNERVLPLAQTLNKNPQIGYRVRAVFLRKKAANLDQLPFCVKSTQDFEELAELIRAYNIKTVITDITTYRSKRMVKELDGLIKEAIEVLELDDFEEELRRKVRLEDVDELWFLRYAARGKRMAYEFFKRLIDITVSLMMLPLGCLIGLVVALAIKIEDNGPIFYSQQRIGGNGRVFTMNKFRTMRPDAERDGARWTVKNDSRITKVGGLLRKSRLDEFPQLINIFKGELSFVGPRSERPEFHGLLKKQIPFYERRYLIKPGLTGWAQINYTYGSSVDDTREKLAYDFYYLKKRSLLFDLGIFLKTVNLVLSIRGR